MDDLTNSASRLRGRIAPEWTEEHMGVALSSVHARLLRRRIRLATTSAIALTLVLALAVMQPWSSPSNTIALEPATPVPTSIKRLAEAAPPQLEPLALSFGHRAVALPLLAETKLIAELVSREAIELRLQEGAARFQVDKQPGQSFRVHAGPVVVVVVGTEFVVSHGAHYVEVSVSEGAVEVMYFGETTTVDVGETRRFLREPVVKTQASLSAGNARESQNSKVQTEEQNTDELSNRSPSLREERKPEPPVVGQGGAESPLDLLQQADIARLREDYGLAVKILRRVLAAQPRTDTEVIAAFSLGRVLSDKLDRPAEASRAFARARAADPAGHLAEDALAREVEALSKAGHKEKARALANEYKRLHPAGRRLRMVLRWGALD